MAKKTTNLKYYEAVGRRKTAIARVRLYILNKEKEIEVKGLKIKKGEIIVNTKPSSEYFSILLKENLYKKPFELTNNLDRFAATVIVKGGGINGQLEAMVLGIAKAIEESDKDLRSILKKEGLLTRDSRIRERRKVGTGGRARRQKQSPKR